MLLFRTPDPLSLRVLLIVTFSFIFVNVKAQLTVNSTPTPTQLVQNNLLGSGVSVSNIQYTGPPLSKGTFANGGLTNLGINSGVILSSGNASGAIGPNNTGSTSTNFGSPGDAFLNTLVSPNPTFDASILEFDFAVASDSIRFKYVFGSEEYNEWVNFTYNDVFGFFLSGPGIPGVRNLATIPGAGIPVSINNVNNGVSPPGIPATGPCTNCAYYRDNTAGTSLQYDGLTTVLTAKSNVTVCETYHIRLAIADAGDPNLDSGVFLESNSFTSFGNINISSSGGTQSGDTIFFCPGTPITLCAVPSVNYSWSTGATTQCITVTTPGYYSCFTSKGSCFAWSNQYILVPAAAPAITVTASGPTQLCPGSNVTLTANSAISPVTWSNGATTQSITVNSAGTYTASVTTGGTCAVSSASISVTMVSNVATVTASGPTTICPTNTVTLTANSGSSYLWSNGATTQSIVVGTTGNYSVTVYQPGGCSAVSAPTNVTISMPVATVTVTGNPVICPGASVVLQANAGSAWLWSNGATTQNINVTTPGSYYVQVTNAFNCLTSSNSVSVTPSFPTATISVSGNQTLCPGDNVTLTANSGSAYLWNNGATTQSIVVSTAGNFNVIVTNTDLCNATSTGIPVNMSNPIASATAGGNTTLCPGQNVTLNANSGSSWLWSNGSTTQSITVGSGGTYSVSVMNADGCSANSNLIPVVNSIPTAAVTASGPVDLCPGTNVTLNANAGQSYLWSNGSTSSSINVSSPGSYSVQVTNTDNCTAASTAINVTSLLAVASITPSGSTLLCPGNNVNLNASSGSAWLWSNGATTQTISVNQAGNYSVTIINSNGCTEVSAPMAVSLSNPSATATPAGNTMLCPGQNVALNANSGSSWLWSNGSTTQSINVGSGGTYSVSVTNSDGCTAISNLIVVSESNPLANITASGPLDLCPGENVTLTANPGQSYLWSDGSTSSTITVSSSGVYSVQVTNTDNCVAVSSNTNVNTLNAVATITAMGPTQLCPGGNVVLAASAGSAWLWSNGETTQNITVTQSGNYSVNVVNSNSCAALTLPVSVSFSTPTASATALSSTDICPGSSVGLTANNGSAWLWSNGATTQQIQVTTSGNYSVQVTDPTGCIANSNSIPVQVITPLANITVQGNTDLCPGQQVILIANTGSNYLWSTGATTQQITLTQTGSYSVQVINSIGCTALSAPITVNALTADATVFANGPLKFCEGGDVTLSANPGSSWHWSTGETTQTIVVNTSGTYTVEVVNTNGCQKLSQPLNVTVALNPVVDFYPDLFGGCAPLKVNFSDLSSTTNNASYLWNFGDGQSSQDKNPTHIYSGVGLYSVQLIVTSSEGCKSELIKPDLIDVADSPVAFMSFYPNNPLLFSSTVQFSDSSAGATSRIWHFGDGTRSDLKDPLHTYDEPGQYTIRLEVENGFGCSNEIIKDIYVFPFYLPNAFSPNGDGYNDSFYEMNFNMNVTSFGMHIYNRWGQLIFESDSQAKTWDGKDLNKMDSPQGVYIVIMDVKTLQGTDHQFKTQLTLIR